jgi:gentisate 1,2-dioxygenase
MAGSNTQGGLQTLYAEMEPHHLLPLWEAMHNLVTPTPRSAASAHLWSYGAARDYLLRAGELISAEQAERRVLILENPSLQGTSAVVPSLFTGLQLIMPGEVAPAHRHTQCALRFVMEGDGAHTSVDGERAVMRPFDLILTPNWQWHDHGNETSQPMIWLDGLDVPTVRFYEASFAEKLPQAAQTAEVEADQSYWLYGRGMRPFRGTAADRRPKDLPLFHYPYQDWRESLAMLARGGAPDPHLGHALEFTNPADGGPIMPTIAAHVRLLPEGFTSKPRRATDGTVFVVVEGSGNATIEGKSFPLQERDIFVVPSWNEISIRADRDLVLFGFSDRAAQEKLSLFREHRA